MYQGEHISDERQTLLFCFNQLRLCLTEINLRIQKLSEKASRPLATQNI